MIEVQQAELDAILQRALDIPDEARASFLDDTCGRRTELRAIVERMLVAGESEIGPVKPAGALSGALWNELVTRGFTAGLETGDRVAAWRIVRTLGQGGMATVYLAERADGQFEQAVALKVLYRAAWGDDAAKRFTQERQILASLNHPNIAHLVDGGLMPSGQPYVALEYIDGVPVDVYCDRERLDPRQRLVLFANIARAVGHAHRNLVIHRDLKASNILVTTDGVPKLLDFGIAKLVDASLPHAAPETRSALHPMTPEYASPEQVRGEALTTASDIYQLGYLLYRLLARAAPYVFDRGNYAAMIEAICKADPSPPSQAVPGDESGAPLTAAERRVLAGDVDVIVLKALRKEPETRYHSAEALADDIGRYLEGLPVTARRGTTGYRARKFMRRHRFGVATSLAFTGLAAGFAAVYTLQAADNARRLAQERDAAQVEAAKALQVTEFLMSLFEASDPRAAGAGEASAREVLARGLARVDALEAQPQVQAQMLDVIGQVYRRLGNYDEAQGLLERAVATWRAASGDESPELAASLAQLGRVLDAQGEYDKALALYREALAMQRKLLGEENAEVARTLDYIGMALDATGEYDAAERVYRQALSLLKKLFGNRHPEVASTMNNLGLLLTRTGDYDEAEALHREALAMRRELLGEEHLDVTYSLNNLALVLHTRGDYAAAEPLYRELLALDRKILGDEHPEVAMDLSNLGSLLADKGEYREAMALQREGLAMRRKLLGSEHPHTSQSLNNLASLYYRLGDYEVAESAAREALEIRRASLGEDHHRVANTLSNLAAILAKQGDDASAERLYREALAISRAALGDAHPDVAHSLHHLALLAARKGDLEAAEALHREAVSIQARATAPENPAAALYRSALAETLTAQGRYDEAEALLLNAYAVLRARRGDDHEVTARVRDRLASLYNAAGRPRKAALYRTEIIAR